MGKSSGGPGAGTQQVSSTTSPPQNVLDNYQSVVNRAQSASNAPLNQYQGPLIAGFTPQQMSAFQTINNTQGVANPYINAASQYAAAGSAPVTPTAFSPDAVNQYLNPYTQDVINATQANFNEGNAEQGQALIGQAIKGGNAFGGDRLGVAQGELARQQQTAQAPVIAGLQNQGYAQALGEFNTQQSADLQAQQASDWLAQNAGFQFGALGNEAQSTALTGANAQLQAGALQQQMGQEQLNIPYEQFLQQQAYPFQTTGWLGNIVEGIGSQSGGTSTTTSPGPSIAGQAGGLGLGALGIGGLFGAFSNRGGRALASGGSTDSFADVDVLSIPGLDRPLRADISPVPTTMIPVTGKGPPPPPGAFPEQGGAGIGDIGAIGGMLDKLKKKQDGLTNVGGTGGDIPTPQSKPPVPGWFGGAGDAAGAADAASSGAGYATDLGELFLARRGGRTPQAFASGGGSLPGWIGDVGDAIGSAVGMWFGVPGVGGMLGRGAFDNVGGMLTGEQADDNGGMGAGLNNLMGGMGFDGGGAVTGYTTGPGRNIPIPVLGTSGNGSSSFATPPAMIGTNTPVAPSSSGLNINPVFNWSPPSASQIAGMGSVAPKPATTPAQSTPPPAQTNSSGVSPLFGQGIANASLTYGPDGTALPNSLWYSMYGSNNGIGGGEGGGSEWRGGRTSRAFGGDVMPSDAFHGFDAGGMVQPGMMASGMPEFGTPGQDSLQSRYTNLPVEQLQQMAVANPPTTSQDAMIRRVLMAKRMNPQYGQKQQQGNPYAQAPTPTGAMRRGGMVRAFAPGGATDHDVGDPILPGDEPAGMVPYMPRQLPPPRGERPSTIWPTWLQDLAPRGNLTEMLRPQNMVPNPRGRGAANVDPSTGAPVDTTAVPDVAPAAPVAAPASRFGTPDIVEPETDMPARIAGTPAAADSPWGPPAISDPDVIWQPNGAEPAPVGVDAMTPSESFGRAPFARPVTTGAGSGGNSVSAPIRAAAMTPPPGGAVRTPSETYVHPTASFGSPPAPGETAPAQAAPAQAEQKAAPEYDRSYAASKWLPLVALGAQMMASRNPTPLGALGEGGLSALKTMGSQAEEARKVQKDKEEAEFKRGEIKRYADQLAETADYHKGHLQQLRDANVESANSRRDVARENAQARVDVARENAAMRQALLDQGRYTWQPGSRVNPETHEPETGMWQLPSRGDEEPKFHAGSTIAGKAAGNQAMTTQLAQELIRTGAAGSLQEALTIIKDPSGNNAAKLVNARETLAANAAKGDLEGTAKPLETLNKYRKFYGLPEVPAAPGAASARTAPAAAAVPPLPTGVPPTAQYSPSQKQFWWQDDSGNWKSAPAQ